MNKSDTLLSKDSLATADSKENLNLFYNKKRLVLKALNKFLTVSEAANALGVSDRTLYRYKQVFRIALNEKKQYVYSDVLTASLKLEIIRHLKMVDAQSIYGACYQPFIDKEEKTDGDFNQLLKEVKEQLRGCPSGMEKTLGDAFPFFSMITS